MSVNLFFLLHNKWGLQRDFTFKNVLYEKSRQNEQKQLLICSCCVFLADLLTFTTDKPTFRNPLNVAQKRLMCEPGGSAVRMGFLERCVTSLGLMLSQLLMVRKHPEPLVDCHCR